MQDALNDLIRRRIPIRGNSARLATLGEFSFSALRDSSKETVQNPYNERVTHPRFSPRFPAAIDHYLCAFCETRSARPPLGLYGTDHAGRPVETYTRIAIDQDNRVLLNANGRAEVTGTGRGAYFYRPTRRPVMCSPGKPLSYRNVDVYRAPTGGTFNVKGTGGSRYTLSVRTVRSTPRSRTEALADHRLSRGSSARSNDR